MYNRNIKVTAIELAVIRSFSNFDLTMFLSEINDHGWEQARLLIPLIVKSQEREAAKVE